MTRFLSATVLLVVGCAAWDANLGAYATIGHKWSVGSVPFYINPQSTRLSSAAAVAAVRRAADVWNTQSAANIEFDYAGTTSGSSLTLNYKNEVFFRNEASPSGYTAATYWWYNGSGALIDADIVFYENYRWYTGGTGCTDGYYVENTGAHEFGHALGLGHSAFDAATMWGGTYGCMTSKETLDADDIAGLEALYPPAGSIETPPPAPSQLTVIPGAADPDGSLTLAWVRSATSDGYRVERSLDGFSFAEIRQLGASATSFTDTGLTAATTYYYRMKAFNESGASGYSNTASGQTQAAAPAPTPSSSSPGKKGNRGRR